MTDEETHTDFCRKEIAKGMLKVKIEYIENKANPEQVQSGEAPGLVGFQEITCHLIFNVKMDFSRKFLDGGQRINCRGPIKSHIFFSCVNG